MKEKLARFIYNKLGDDWGGTPSPPGVNCRLEFGEPDDDGQPMHIATTDNNDGFELWIGYSHKWLFFTRAEHARKLAWFILWQWWAKGTWFGLKRKLWYWALHVEVSGFTCKESKSDA